MNKLFMVLSLIFCGSTTQIQAQGIQFESNLSWKKIKEKARQEHKFIIMDTYATWCGPCKQMSNEVFPLKDVGDLINPNFIAVKMQMDKTNNDSEFIKSNYADAESINQIFKITAYPTLLFFSPEGELVSRFVGFLDGEHLIIEAKKALDPQKQYYTLLEDYKLGKLDTSSLKALVYQADAIGDKTISRSIAEVYSSKIKKADIFKKKNLFFIGRFINGSKDKNFKLFFEQANKINSIVGLPNYAEFVVMRIVSQEEIEPHAIDPIINWSSIELSAKSKFGRLGEERVWVSHMLYANDKRDWQNFGKYYKLYFDRIIPFKRSSVHINNLSWPVVEHVTDPVILRAAINAMKFSIENYDQNNYQAYDTYANLLYKLGRKKEAIDWEKKALKGLPEDKGITETLQKMKRGEVIFPEKPQ